MYTERARDHLRSTGHPVLDTYVGRLTPLGHAHLTMLGRYTFALRAPIVPGEWHPLQHTSRNSHYLSSRADWYLPFPCYREPTYRADSGRPAGQSGPNQHGKRVPPRYAPVPRSRTRVTVYVMSIYGAWSLSGRLDKRVANITQRRCTPWPCRAATTYDLRLLCAAHWWRRAFCHAHPARCVLRLSFGSEGATPCCCESARQPSWKRKPGIGNNKPTRGQVAPCGLVVPRFML